MKALFYVNKAIDIDEQNPKYWLFYSKINKHLNYFEEAERGFKRTIEYGDNSVEIWIERGDILIQLGEIEAAKFNFKQALDLHPKNEELEYRISGIYFVLNKFKKGFKYLLIALHRNPEYVFIIEELFPNVYRNKKIIQFIKDYNRSSR